MASNTQVPLETTILNGPRKKKAKGRPGWFLLFCTAIYALLLLAVSISNLIGPERWGFGSLNLYLPQWPWALPCVPLFPWYLITAWRWTWVPFVMAAWVFGPIMGFSLHPPMGNASTSAPPVANSWRLRVMTYNVKWGMRNAKGVLANIAEAKPDLILMQDSAGAMEINLAPLRTEGWHIIQMGQYNILSKLPISDAELRWITPDHTHTCLRCKLHLGKTDVTLYDVHLITPRWALGSVQENGTEAMDTLEQNVTLRQLEATLLASYLQEEKGPVILTGDLNVPVQSRSCQILMREGLRDAFSESGWGYGFTYGQTTPIQKPYMRIDHILCSRHWDVLECRTGSPIGSDHSPVIADLELPAQH